MKSLNKIMCIIGYCACAFVLIWYVAVNVNHARLQYVKTVRENRNLYILSQEKPQLANSINDFIVAVQNQDWSVVYSYMNTELRNAFTYEYFMIQLSELDSIEHQKQWKIVDVNYYNNQVRVIVKFKSKFGEKYTVSWWVKDGQNWSCIPSWPFKFDFSMKCRSLVLDT